MFNSKQTFALNWSDFIDDQEKNVLKKDVTNNTGNTGHEVLIHPEWDARPLQGTIHTYSDTWGNSECLSVLMTFMPPRSGFLTLPTATILQRKSQNINHSKFK